MSVYYIAAPSLDLVKIGYAKNPILRRAKIASDCPVEVVLMAVEAGDQSVEADRHARFSDSRRRAEWFQLSGPVADHVATLPPHVKPERQRRATAMAEAVGICTSHAASILRGKTRPSLELAVRMFLATGWKAERIAHVSDDDIRNTAHLIVDRAA
jgi:hypothetical protein